MSEASKAYPREATFTAADGKTYTVRPLTLDGLIAIEERYKLDSIEDAFNTERLQLMKAANLRFLLWTVLKAAHPDLTEEETGRIIDVQNLPEGGLMIPPVHWWYSFSRNPNLLLTFS